MSDIFVLFVNLANEDIEKLPFSIPFIGPSANGMAKGKTWLCGDKRCLSMEWVKDDSQSFGAPVSFKYALEECEKLIREIRSEECMEFT